MLNGLIKRLASPGLGLALLGLLALAMMAGGTLPQSRRFTSADFNEWRNRWPNLSGWLEWSGLTDIYASPWFATLSLALALNLGLAMVFYLLRMRAWLAGNGRPTHTLAGQGQVPAKILAAAGSRHDGGIQQTGTWGLWGIPLLHAGIALIVLAAFAVRSERFAAHLELAEGEVFSGQPEKLVIESGDRTAPALPFGIRVDALEIRVLDGKHLHELNARLTVHEASGTARKELLRVNAPLEIGPYGVYLDKTFGWTAVFDRVRPNGERARLLVNFPASKAQWPDRGELSRQTTATLDSQPIALDMKLAPGDSPRFGLVATQENRKLFEGELLPGESADLGHYRLVFRGSVPWAGLYLTRESWTLAIFAGYAMALVGGLLQLLFRPRRIQLTKTGESWSLAAWAMPSDLAFEREWQSLANPS